ncbi:MAG: hypothetical protein JNJ99_03300, partial [Crocinitomicaceae bacterium]|nr:hypothetical protein [Crocinitomicaceae bacterium]
MLRLNFFIFLSGIITISNAQCDSISKELFGVLTTNTISSVQIKSENDSRIPSVGAICEMNKYFETTLFGFKSTGWLSIADVVVTKVQGESISVKVLSESSEMTINGEKKNHFEKGNRVQLTWKEAPRNEPFYHVKDGDTLAIGNYFCEQKTGTWTFFYPSGKVQEIDQYQDGYLHGNYKVWNEQGILIEDGNYENGKRNGALNFYYEDGKLNRTENYLNDSLHGVST